MLTIPDLIGILLFVFDLFGPIKALYTQATRLTVMNSCMDRIGGVFPSRNCRMTVWRKSPLQAMARRWNSGMSASATKKKRCFMTFPSSFRKTRCWPWWGLPAAENPPSQTF